VETAARRDGRWVEALAFLGLAAVPVIAGPVFVGNLRTGDALLIAVLAVGTSSVGWLSRYERALRNGIELVCLALVYIVSFLLSSLLVPRRVLGEALQNLGQVGFLFLVLVPVCVAVGDHFRGRTSMWLLVQAYVWANLALIALAITGTMSRGAAVGGAFRWTTIFAESGNLAQYGVAGVAIGSASVLFAPATRGWIGRGFQWLGIFASMAVILLDGSRTALLFTVLVLPVFLLSLTLVRRATGSRWANARRSFALAFLVACSAGFAVTYFAVRTRPVVATGARSAYGIDPVRTMQYEGALRELSARPWGGYGFDYSRYHMRAGVIHDGFLESWVEGGFPAMLALAGILLLPLLQAFLLLFGAERARGRETALCAAAACVLAYTAFHMLVHPMTVVRENWLHYAIAAGTIYGQKAGRTSRRTAPSEGVVERTEGSP